MGSSPPVRGARTNLGCDRGRYGLIPARAGSTILSLDLLVCSWAHPRPCGEHRCNLQCQCTSWGSSPPVRGAPPGRAPYCLVCGLIPARAGSTRHECVRCYRRWAHPRPCGEHVFRVAPLMRCRGSSPPVRGAHMGLWVQLLGAGLIPARAGSTARSRIVHLFHWAHPRPCGEHTTLLVVGKTRGGSSPPVRGARGFCCACVPVYGLIPARAGSTSARRSPARTGWAHPRPCGEHRQGINTYAAEQGSSPPVRGARRRVRWQSPGSGLIPARAGSTPNRC